MFFYLFINNNMKERSSILDEIYVNRFHLFVNFYIILIYFIVFILNSLCFIIFNIIFNMN